MLEGMKHIHVERKCTCRTFFRILAISVHHVGLFTVIVTFEAIETGDVPSAYILS